MAQRTLTPTPSAPSRAPASPQAPESPELPLVESPKTQPHDDARARQPTLRRRWMRWGLFAMLPLVLIGATYWYVTGGQIMATDDAYVNADKVGISTDVSGIVQSVDVVNNERVAAGQILFRLNPRQFQIALDNAKANLAQTALSLDAMKVDYQRMLSDAQAQQAQVNLDSINFNRAKLLLSNGTAAQATYDQANATLQVDTAKLQSLQHQAQVQLARLNGSADTPTTQLPAYQQAQAQVEEAQRQLDDAVVKAPFSGIATDVPSTTQGRYLPASTTAFYLVDTEHVWVDAEPKETELTYVRPGQPVTVTVDAYPNRVWRGTVQSISPAASQEFSLLPAQNTSGNWVKVVQRVPMRVSLDTTDAKAPPLRAGMSAEVNVDTGHARGFPHFLSSLF
jgi:membrane fusion protein (multidrug efflux system)